MIKTKSGKNVSSIGIGTWTIKRENLGSEVDALKYYVAAGGGKLH